MELVFDSLTTQEYDARLYEAEAILEPLADWTAVTPAHDEQYRELGFLSVGGAYSPAEVGGVLDGLADLVCRELPPPVQLQFESSARGKVEGMSGVERLDYVRKFMTFYSLDERIVAMARKPELWAVVERLLGAEPEIYQDMALLKPPGIGREKPWHQDHAYFNLPIGTPVVGVWIALDQATTENGCMVFLPGGHREGPLPHFNRRDWQICDSEVVSRSGKVAAPLPSGGCLIFDGLTPHGTATNHSNTRRRALQFHYIPKGTRHTTIEERMEIFGEGAFGATC